MQTHLVGSTTYFSKLQLRMHDVHYIFVAISIENCTSR
jgi:hypothetical protein